jgi:hypothetical protein
MILEKGPVTIGNIIGLRKARSISLHKSRDPLILLRQNDEFAVQRCRYMTLESVSRLTDSSIITWAARSIRPARGAPWLRQRAYTTRCDTILRRIT